MKGIEAYLSYSCKMGMVPEFHYPVMRILETISTGGPLTPVFQVSSFAPKLIQVHCCPA
jgi:hypothetical protein